MRRAALIVLLVCAGARPWDGFVASAAGQRTDAAAHRLAILGLAVEGLEPDLRRRCLEELHAALRRAGYAIVPEAETRAALARAGVPATCAVGPCVARLPDLVQARQALVGGVVVQGTSYETILVLIDLETGAPLRQSTARCDACTTIEGLGSVRRAGVGLAQLPREPSRPVAAGPAAVSTAAVGTRRAPARPRTLTLEAGLRAVSYPSAGRDELGAGVAARLGGRALRGVVALDVLRQQATREGVDAGVLLLVPIVGLELVARARVGEGWVGARAGLAHARVTAHGAGVTVGTTSSTEPVVGAVAGAALHRGRLRLAAELGLQALPASHGYTINGAELAGTASFRVVGALSLGVALY